MGCNTASRELGPWVVANTRISLIGRRLAHRSRISFTETTGYRAEADDLTNAQVAQSAFDPKPRNQARRSDTAFESVAYDPTVQSVVQCMVVCSLARDHY